MDYFQLAIDIPALAISPADIKFLSWHIFVALARG